MITKDVHLQNAIVAAKTYQQLEAVVNEQQYRNLFTKEKWANILRCIAESELDSGGLLCGRNTLTTSDNQQVIVQISLANNFFLFLQFYAAVISIQFLSI